MTENIATTELLRPDMPDTEAASERLLAEVFGDVPPIPVDLNRIAAHIGLEVKQGPFKDSRTISHYVESENCVYIAHDVDYRRQAFTLAHVIGHRRLHPDCQLKETMYSHIDTWLDLQDDYREQEANYFAASLLMPRQILAGYLFGLNYHHTEELAAIFMVSKSAMLFRYRQLEAVAE